MLYSTWLSLPISTRAKIAKQFGIEKKGATHVQDNTIQSDGYFVKDIEMALNREAMQKYLVTDEMDMAKLFDMLVQCIENPIPVLPDNTTTIFSNTKLDNPVIPAEAVPLIQEIIKKRGRPAKTK